jgi:hypothetical protein
MSKGYQSCVPVLSMLATMDGNRRSYTGSMIEYGIVMIPITDTDKVLPTGDDDFKIH